MGLFQRWRERRLERRADRQAVARERLDELPVGEDPEAAYNSARNTFESRYPQNRRGG